MDMLGRYEMTTKLSNKDAGNCMWCYAKYGGEEYFIKEFTTPKYPENDTESTPERREKKRKKCEAFEREKSETYRIINAHSDGNAVRIAELFRVGAKYYMAMPRIKGEKMTEEEIASLPEHIKRRLCAVIAHSVAGLHACRFVHSDIKHTNILITHSRTRKLTAKLIDYDSGFFEYDPPKHSEEVGGDEVYLSPEALLVIEEEPAELTCKIDVFALGILFHQYLTGTVPAYDEKKFSSVGDAVLRGGEISVSWDMPVELHHLLCRMLAADPSDRPSAQEAYEVLIKPMKQDNILQEEVPQQPVEEVQCEPEPKFVGDAYGRDGWWTV